MGYTQSFFFVDPREGECGVAYHRPTREEAEELAAALGCGAVQVKITAYPPRPSAADLACTVVCADEPIPF